MSERKRVSKESKIHSNLKHSLHMLLLGVVILKADYTAGQQAPSRPPSGLSPGVARDTRRDSGHGRGRGSSLRSGDHLAVDPMSSGLHLSPASSSQCTQCVDTPPSLQSSMNCIRTSRRNFTGARI